MKTRSVNLYDIAECNILYDDKHFFDLCHQLAEVFVYFA